MWQFQCIDHNVLNWIQKYCWRQCQNLAKVEINDIHCSPSPTDPVILLQKAAWLVRHDLLLENPNWLFCQLLIYMLHEDYSKFLRDQCDADDFKATQVIFWRLWWRNICLFQILGNCYVHHNLSKLERPCNQFPQDLGCLPSSPMEFSDETLTGNPLLSHQLLLITLWTLSLSTEEWDNMLIRQRDHRMLHFQVSVVTVSPASFSYIFFAQPFLIDTGSGRSCSCCPCLCKSQLHLSFEFPNAALYTKVAFQNYSTAAHPCFHLPFSTFLVHQEQPPFSHTNLLIHLFVYKSAE